MMPLYGAIEAGGTKFVCAVAEKTDCELIEKISFPTTSPEETLGKAITFFQRYPLSAIGIACFGPIDLHPESPTYGYIMATPKPGWKHTDLIRPLNDALRIPIGFDTDVNGAALGEYSVGKTCDSATLVYFTVGTGIGAGIIMNGQPVHGSVHPEVGHILVSKHPDDPFAGNCPYHGNCLEGMASGPAIHERWGLPAELLPAEHFAWELEAFYLAQAVNAVTYMLSPKKVILGGGVMHQARLIPSVQRTALQLLNGYLAYPSTLEAMENLITPPQLGDDSGIRGALELAIRALQSTMIPGAN